MAALAQYDEIVRLVYCAAAGMETWVAALARIAAAFDAWVVHFHGADKRGGHMMFSYEAGPAPPEAGIDYIRHYHRVDPRAGLVSQWPVGKWLACQEHFDEAYVASSPFYQEFLIPYGARYVFGAKVFEDEAAVVLFGHLGHLGKPPLDESQRDAFARIGQHLGQAFSIHRHLGRIVDRDALGFALLDRLSQPVVLLN